MFVLWGGRDLNLSVHSLLSENLAVAVADIKGRASLACRSRPKQVMAGSKVGHKVHSQSQVSHYSRSIHDSGNHRINLRASPSLKNCCCWENCLNQFAAGTRSMQSNCLEVERYGWVIAEADLGSWGKATALESSFCSSFYSLQWLLDPEVASQQFMVENIAVFFH